MDNERYDDPLGPLAYPEHRREATLLRLHGWDVWWEYNDLDELWRLEYEPPQDVDERIAAIKFGSTWGEGRYGVLHRSTYPGVEWQLSRFDQYGPWGHGEHDTIAEAVKDGKRHYGFYVEEIVELNPHLPIWLQKQPKVIKGQADTYASTDGRVEIVNTRRVVIRDPGGGKRRVRMWALTVDRVEHGEYESLEDAFEALLATDYEVPSEGKKRKRAKMKPRKKRPVPAPVKEPTRARSARPRQPSKPAQATARRPALEALTGLGWKRREAEAAVDAVLSERPQAPTELVVRRAMIEMAHKRSVKQGAPSSADIMATRLKPRPTQAPPPDEPKARFTAKELNDVVKRTLKKYPGLIVTNVSLDDSYELRFDVQNIASSKERSAPALSVSLQDETLFATQVYEETRGDSWEFDVKNERALVRAFGKAIRESLGWLSWTKATKGKPTSESLERPWSRSPSTLPPKTSAKPPAKRSRPTRRARREAAEAAGVAVCPSAVYEMFEGLAPVFSTNREQSPYWQERYDLVLQMFPSVPLVETDEDGDETYADSIDWWTTDLLTETQRRRLHRAVIGRRFGSVVRALRDAKRIADKFLKSKAGTKKRDDLQKKLEKAEARYRQEIDGMVELFEADTAEEDWLSERAAADLDVGAFGPGVGEAWSTVDFCARELVYGTADRRALAASDIAAMRQGALFGASPRSERSAPPAKARQRPSGPIYYASGTNMVPEARGMLDAGHQVGVAIHKVSAPQRRKFVKLAAEQPGMQLFVDSGAFSEVSTTAKDQKKAKRKGTLRPLPGTRQSSEVEPGVLKVVAPISDAEWLNRLADMQELAEAFGQNALIVAPDHVGSQKETLKRLRRYQASVKAIRDTGAEVMVVLQGGPMNAIEFDQAATEALGTSDYVVGWPMQKAWTPLGAISAFAKARPARRMHLLGVGPKSRTQKDSERTRQTGKLTKKPGAKDIRTQLFDAFPEIEWSWDSCLICSAVQRGATYIRDFTQAQDIVQTDIEAEALTSTDHVDYTDVAGTPSMWLFELWGARPLARARAEMKRGRATEKKKAELEKRIDFFLKRSLETAELAGVAAEDLDAFRADPNAWYHHREPDDPEGPERWERDPYAESAMEREFLRWLRSETSGERKRRAAALAFGPHWPLDEDELPHRFRKDPRYTRKPKDKPKVVRIPVRAPGKDPNHPWWDSVDDPGFARGPAGEVYKVHVGYNSPSFGPGGTSPSFGRILRADEMLLEVEPERDRKLGPPWRVRIWPAPWHGTYHQITERGWDAVEERFDTWEDAVAGMRRLALLPWQYLPGGDLESALVLAQAESPNASAREQQGVAELIVRSHEPWDDPESTSDHPRASRQTEELLANMIEAQELYAYALHPTRTQSERAEAEERLRELLTKRDQKIAGSSTDMSWPYQTALLQFAQWKRGMRDAPVLDEEEQPKKKRKKASRKKAPPRVKKPKSNPRARAHSREARLRDPEAGRQGMTTAQLLRKMGL